MIVKLFDKTEIFINKDQADNIAKMIEQDYKLIDINGNLVRPSAIAAIMKGGRTQVDVAPEDHRLPQRVETNEDYQRARAKVAEIRQKMFNK